ncbi:tetratricopeptide repeat protein [Elongatibacter sediminis]|uniref:Tetratricopeptide repeat protein n=1 Tax=Elongatibacter sediminis TaxID=3119006 RepID=A0AAW9RPV4_9GAMM
MRLLTELKRRNVVRIGIAYLVGSWLLVQAADLLLDIIGAEDWVLRSVVVLLALGFVPALIFAWAFELTPEGIKKESEIDRTRSITQHTAKKLDIVTIVLLIAAIGLLALDRLIPGLETAPPAPAKTVTGDPGHPAPATPAAASSVRSIAVLPFANRSNQDDDLFFTDGIHDDLLTQLAKVHDLTVISRTSVMEYRDSPKNLKQIGSELDVGTILEGGVQKVGERVRINAQLIDVATDRHLWAETFDRELTAENVFELQSEIARRIVEAVAVELSPEEERLLSEVPTQSLAAYEAYLKAREVFYGANYARSQEEAAQPYLEKAIALDPDYADAYVMLSTIYGQLYWRGIDTSAEMLKKYRDTLDRAMALKPDAPGPLRARANYYYRVENDYRTSLDLLHKAVAGAPGNVDIHGDLGLTLRRLGRFDESIRSFERALELDPANRFYHSILLETMNGARRWQDVIEHSVPLEDADPDDLDIQVTRAWALLNLTGDLKPLERVFERMNLVASTQFTSFSAYVHWLQRDYDGALEVLRGPVWQEVAETPTLGATRRMQIADVLRVTGDTEGAEALYERIARAGDELAGQALQVQVYDGGLAAIAWARLGENDKALDIVNGLVERVPPERDAMLQPDIYYNRAMVRGLAGDEAGAIADLEVALSVDGAFPRTSWDLHYDPNWDFLRDNERFAELATPDNLVRTKGP